MSYNAYMLNVKCLITSYNGYMLTGKKNCNDSSSFALQTSSIGWLCMLFYFKWFDLFFKKCKKNY